MLFSVVHGVWIVYGEQRGCSGLVGARGGTVQRGTELDQHGG